MVGSSSILRPIKISTCAFGSLKDALVWTATTLKKSDSLSVFGSLEPSVTNFEKRQNLPS
jgi:hypothetical protein